MTTIELLEEAIKLWSLRDNSMLDFEAAFEDWAKRARIHAALDAAPADDVSHRMICELNDLEKIQAGEPVRCTCRAPAGDGAAALVEALEALPFEYLPASQWADVIAAAKDALDAYRARKAPVQG